MTKFNQELYASSSIENQDKPGTTHRSAEAQVVEKEVAEKGLSNPVPEEGWATSPIVSIEEVTPHSKKCRTGDKGKEKVGASIWADAGMALVKAHEVLGEMMHITSQYLKNEEKAVVANSKAKALKAAGSRLRKDLIAAMDNNNASKEKIKALFEELKAEKLLMT
ncbi:hypothetical protein SO802_008220 [Lithocarpus litseifolius]|uniref:Uncharacterized protein n=1 Tax=Lithocarpus litseifolius TaxID=425828 RepID=A0AAW2DAJ3_9ROSI